MALTPVRWLAVFVVAALAVLTYMLRPVPTPSWGPSGQRLLLARSAARNSVERQAEQIRLLRVADSLSLALGRNGGDSSRIVVSDGLPGNIREMLAPVVARMRPLMAITPRNPIDVVFVFDSASVLSNGVPRRRARSLAVDFAMPTLSAPRCMTIVRLGPLIRNIPQWLQGDQFLRTTLGPCAFIERFGVPGPQLDAWLRRGGWGYGRIGITPWEYPHRYSAGSRQDQRLGYFRYGMSYRFHYLGPAGTRCADGDAAACETLFVNAQTRSPQLKAWSERIISLSAVTVYDPYADYYNNGSLGPDEWSVLADMAHALGVDRFQKFWSSPLPVADAFRSATMEDLGTWLSTWAASSYSAPELGPDPSYEEIAASAFLVVLGLAGATIATKRRQAG